MGKRYLIKNGKEVEIDENSEFAKVLTKVNTETPLCFGQVVKYKVGNEVHMGKVTGMNPQKQIKIAKVVNATKAGFQFSCTDYDCIQKSDIIEMIK